MRDVWSDVGLWLWRLLPGNPIVVRVVTIAGKSHRHLGVRAAYLSVLFTVVLVSQLARSDGATTLAELAKSASQVFSMVSLLQLGLVCLLAPVFAAGAISQEKDAETFNVLLTTPLTNAQIVLGSLAARMFFVVALLIAGLPIFGITMLFGGVTADQILLSFGIAACTAVMFGAVAILISVTRVGTRGTILWFYVGIALYLMVGLALGRLHWTYVPGSVVPGISDGMTWLALVHPFWSLLVVLGQIRPPSLGVVSGYPWPLPHLLAAPHGAYMGLSILTSLVMVTLATVFVRSGARQGEASLWQRIRGRLLFGRPSAEALAKQRRRPRRVWANPVAWREAVTRAGAASSNLSRYSYLALSVLAGVGFVYLYAANRFGSVTLARQWLVWIVMIETMVVLLMTAATAATAITRERDEGTMELLLTTPLTSRYIIWGKLRGLVGFALPLLAVPMATVLIVALYDWWRGTISPVVTPGRAVMLPVLLTVYAAFVCVVGLHMSLRSRRSVQAVLATVGLLMGIAFGLGMCAFVATDLGSKFAAVFGPFTFVTALIFVLDPSQFLTQASRLGGVVPFELAGFMAVGTVLAVVLYGGLVVGVSRSMVTKFDMIIRKQSE